MGVIDTVKAVVSVAFLLTAGLRVRWVWFMPASRGSHATWWGTVFLGVVFAINNWMIPERTLEQLASSPNAFHLVRSVFAFLGIWCFHIAMVDASARTAQRQLGGTRKIFDGLFPATTVAVMVISFGLVQQHGLSHRFLPEHITQVPTVVYGVTFMAATSWAGVSLAVRAFWISKEQWRLADRVLLALMGAAFSMLTIGFLANAVLLVATHYEASSPVLSWIREHFDAWFMASISLLALVLIIMGSLAFGRTVAARASLVRIFPLWKRMGAADVVLLPSRPGLGAALSHGADTILYRAIVSIDDVLERGDYSLSREEKRTLERSRRALARGTW